MGNETIKIHDSEYNEILRRCVAVINNARKMLAQQVASIASNTYWHIGERINRDVLGNERAEYGKQIVSQVATQLQSIYGHKGFEERTVRRMMQFAQQFPNWEIVSPLVTKLSWTHFVQQIQKSLEVAKAKWGCEGKEDEDE